MLPERITLLSLDQVASNWGLLKKHILWPRFEDGYTVEWLQSQIAKGHLCVWVLGDCELVVLTQIVLLPNGTRVLEIIWAQGRGVERYIEMGFEVFQRFAHFAGCKRIEVRGRGGWTKMFRRLPGVRVEYIYSVDVPSEVSKGR